MSSMDHSIDLHPEIHLPSMPVLSRHIFFQAPTKSAAMVSRPSLRDLLNGVLVNKLMTSKYPTSPASLTNDDRLLRAEMCPKNHYLMTLHPQCMGELLRRWLFGTHFGVEQSDIIGQLAAAGRLRFRRFTFCPGTAST